jgi:hypothetical protein
MSHAAAHLASPIRLPFNKEGPAAAWGFHAVHEILMRIARVIVRPQVAAFSPGFRAADCADA